MTGIIILCLIRFTEEKQSNSGKERLLKETGLDEEEIEPTKVYPEEVFQKLVTAFIKLFDRDIETFERQFAVYMIGILKEKFPKYFESAKNAKEFLIKVPQIHTSFATAGTGIVVEKIKIDRLEEKRLIYHYKSPNKLCIFMKTLIEQVLQLYGEKGNIIETQCMKRRKDYCEIIVEFIK
jgi:predicted hydrocarbon binding protein